MPSALHREGELEPPGVVSVLLPVIRTYGTVSDEIATYILSFDYPSSPPVTMMNALLFSSGRRGLQSSFKTLNTVTRRSLASGVASETNGVPVEVNLPPVFEFFEIIAF